MFRPGTGQPSSGISINISHAYCYDSLQLKGVHSSYTRQTIHSVFCKRRNVPHFLNLTKVHRHTRHPEASESVQLVDSSDIESCP